MGASEKAILNQALIAVSALPETLVFRNNTGTAWQGDSLRLVIGQTITVDAGMKILRNARPITFGLPGSGDIMGSSQGRPVSIEVKDEQGRQAEVQKHFERAWVRAGGVYILARSPHEAVERLIKCL